MPISISLKQLNHRHKKYRDNLHLWKLYMAVFKGIDAIIKQGYIKQHEREEDLSYQRRLDNLYSFAYSKSVVGIYVYHLMSKPPIGRSLKEIESDEIWDMFWKDSNLQGDDFDTVMGSMALYASIQGHIGILVDKPPAQAKTRADQIKNKLHPYLSMYHPPSILDWAFEKNPDTHRPELVYIKLQEDDGRIRIIWKEGWALFEPPKKDKGTPARPEFTSNSVTGDKKGPGGTPAPGSIPIDVSGDATTQSGIEEKVTSIEDGINPLGEIPFIWFYNEKTDDRGIGESDLNEIARIDLSLITNASHIEEIITYAAFPMMMKAKRDASTKDTGSAQEDETGVQAVIEFDPEFPESKPSWLIPEVESAINAVLSYMGHKVKEIYRAANIGGLAATEISTQAKSGVALKTEFQILNAKLVRKATNLEKAENKIVEFVLKWEDRWKQLRDKVSMGRSKSFNVEDIASDLANALTAKSVIESPTFSVKLQQQVSRQVLPSISEDDQATIDQEIEDMVKKAMDAIDKTRAIDSADEETQDIIDEGTAPDLNDEDQE